ncbi:hypothetical protein UFOVP581_22 [uncultured Caudovirales phage]|uniref:Uncharacterized protein n=1 Tax=uncultured Caudovirales phage TaxID=2100421 RepID=A0A6J5PHG6_9CAUD|nr:hypothetical protein UFOVP581_22 [uncultured Caudovirales phage]
MVSPVNLSRATSLSTADQVVIVSSANGDARRVSLGVLLQLFEQQFASPTLSTSVYTPSTGANITVPSPISEQQWILLRPVATIAALTLTLPLNTGTPDGTEITVTSTQAITALTVSANGASTVSGAPATMAANAFFKLRFNTETNIWYRIG